MFPTDSLITTHFSKALGASGMELPRESVTSFSMHVRMQLLATGRFLTILHGSTLQYYAKPWSLKALQVDLGVPPLPIAIFKLRNRTLSPVVRLFVEQARAVSKLLAEKVSRKGVCPLKFGGRRCW
jgi:DNA-binding transcriptional LysR family regulator